MFQYKLNKMCPTEKKLDNDVKGNRSRKTIIHFSDILKNSYLFRVTLSFSKQINDLYC